MGIILITGSTGYIGSRLCEWMAINAKDTIRSISRKNTDYFNDESIKKACEGADTVIHLASLNEKESSENPEEALKVNTALTLRLLNASISAGVRKFIYFSTAHVYGSPLTGFIDELKVPRPVTPYSITHKAAEDFVNEKNDRKKISGLIFRLSNCFGYPLNSSINQWNLVVNDLCRQAVTVKKLILKSSGIQKRDFITMTDVCRAAGHIISLDDLLLKDNIFNLGGDNAMSIYEIAEYISDTCFELFSYKPPVERPDPAQGENAGSLFL